MLPLTAMTAATEGMTKEDKDLSWLTLCIKNMRGKSAVFTIKSEVDFRLKGGILTHSMSFESHTGLGTELYWRELEPLNIAHSLNQCSNQKTCCLQIPVKMGGVWQGSKVAVCPVENRCPRDRLSAWERPPPCLLFRKFSMAGAETGGTHLQTGSLRKGSSETG